ncbi:MAG TPA: GNAT family N-acetyltransferase [Usitatibacter sp.]|nr:GNAT family N-acetyltransferase [Usitatibacter sp.]
MRPDARRIEELSLNSSAPPGQLIYDGWILRMLRGKAKRARSVNAVYTSTIPLPEKIGYCERLYGQAGVPALFRITPFSNPHELDRSLESRGYERFDPTSVESATINSAQFTDGTAEAMELRAWVEAVGELRGSPAVHRDAHFARIDGMPLRKVPVAVRDEGRIVATGLAIVEEDCVGLFDIITHVESQRRGHAKAIVTTLLRRAWDLGARHAYLQVQEENEVARRLYAQFGFSQQYVYWYRGRSGETQ